MMPGTVGDENAVAKPYLPSGAKGLGGVRGKLHPNATGKTGTDIRFCAVSRRNWPWNSSMRSTQDTRCGGDPCLSRGFQWKRLTLQETALRLRTRDAPDTFGQSMTEHLRFPSLMASLQPPSVATTLSCCSLVKEAFLPALTSDPVRCNLLLAGPCHTGAQQGLKDASARNGGLGGSGGKLRTPGDTKGLGMYQDGAGEGAGAGEGVSGAGEKTAGGGLKRAPRAALRNITNATPRQGGLGGGGLGGGGKGLSVGKGAKGLGGVAVMVDGPKGLASQGAVLRDPTRDSLRGAAGIPEVSQSQAQGQEGVRDGSALGVSEADVLAAKYASEGEGFERWAGMAGDEYTKMLQAQEDAGKAQDTVTRLAHVLTCSRAYMIAVERI